jgi:hypothetical protein
MSTSQLPSSAPQNERLESQMHHHILHELDEKPSFNVNENKQELEEKNQQLESYKKKLHEAEQQKIEAM